MFLARLRKRQGVRPHREPRLGIVLAILILVPLGSTAIVRGEDPARRGSQELLKLVPPDSGVLLTVDDLRGQARMLLGSRLAAEILRVPVVKSWFDSEKFEQLETARDQIEGMLQAKLTEIRDEVLGDAVVFALRLPPEGPADPARAQGLLVLKARDPALLRRLIDLINTLQRNNGELAEVAERKRGEVPYAVRQFPAGSNRGPDAYVAFGDGTFAISNSEELVQGVIDRKCGTAAAATRPATGLDAAAKLRRLGPNLPEQALARLFVDARLLEGLIKSSSHPRSTGEALIEGYVGALDSVGAALVVQDDRIALHTAEIFHRGLPELAGRSAVASPASPIDRVPATALGVGVVQLDLAALYKLLRGLVPDSELPRLSNAEIALQGILLGKDLQSAVLPGMGPRVLACVDAPTGWESKSDSAGSPGQTWPFPAVLAVELAGETAAPSTPRGPGASVADALENALNTVLALVSLDEKRARTRPRIVAREVAGGTIRTLDPPIPFAYALDRTGRRLVLGNSVAAVERYLAAGLDPEAGARFRRLKDRAFGNAPSWFCIDLAAVQAVVEAHRARLIESTANNEHRSRDDVARDLDQMLALARIFDAAYLTAHLDADSKTVRHTLGLLVRPAGAQAPSPKP